MAYLDSNFDGTDAIMMRNSWHYFLRITWRAISNIRWPHIIPQCLGSHSQEPRDWDGRTIGDPGLHSGWVSQEVDQELSKMGGARASGEQKSPNWVQGQNQ